MKSIKKFLFVMVALAAVWSFVSCSSDDDGPKTIAVYEDDFLAPLYIETLTFYDDDTFKNVGTAAGEKFTAATGTYKGDVTKDTSADNKVTFTVKKMAGADSKLLSIEDYVEKIGDDIKDYTDAPATIKNGVLYCKFGEYKLKK